MGMMRRYDGPTLTLRVPWNSRDHLRTVRRACLEGPSGGFFFTKRDRLAVDEEAD